MAQKLWKRVGKSLKETKKCKYHLSNNSGYNAKIGNQDFKELFLSMLITVSLNIVKYTNVLKLLSMTRRINMPNKTKLQHTDVHLFPWKNFVFIPNPLST